MELSAGGVRLHAMGHVACDEAWLQRAPVRRVTYAPCAAGAGATLARTHRRTRTHAQQALVAEARERCIEQLMRQNGTLGGSNEWPQPQPQPFAAAVGA